MQGRLGIIIYKQGNNYEGRASGILKQYGKGRAGRTHCEGGGGVCNYRFLCCQGKLESFSVAII